MEISSIFPVLRFTVRYARPRLGVIVMLVKNGTINARLASKNRVHVSLRRQNALKVACLLEFERVGLVSILNFVGDEATVYFQGQSPVKISLDDLEFLRFVKEGRILIETADAQFVTVRIVDLKISLSGPIGLLKDVVRAILFSHYYDKVEVFGKAVVDIGAFIGDSAVCYASQGARAVYAFEPSKEFAEIARKNVAPYKNVFLYDHGLGSCNRTVRLSGYGLGKAVSSSGSEEVEVRDARVVLQSILKKEGEIGLMKINCEGCEWELLDCFNRFVLDHVSAIHIQIHSGDHNALLSKLTEAGFIVKDAEHPPDYPAMGTYVLEKL